MTSLLRDPEWHIRRIIIGEKVFEVFNPLFSFLINEDEPYRTKQRTAIEEIYINRYREKASLITERYGRRRIIEAMTAFRNSISAIIHSESRRESPDSKFCYKSPDESMSSDESMSLDESIPYNEPSNESMSIDDSMQSDDSMSSNESSSSDESTSSSSDTDSSSGSSASPNSLRIFNRELRSFPDVRELEGSDDEHDEIVDYSKEPGAHFRARYIGKKLGREIYQIKQKYEETSFYDNIPKIGVYNITTLMKTIPTYEPAYVLIKGLYDSVKMNKNWHDVDVKSPKLYKIVQVQEN